MHRVEPSGGAPSFWGKQERALLFEQELATLDAVVLPRSEAPHPDGAVAPADRGPASPSCKDHHLHRRRARACFRRSSPTLSHDL